MSTRKALLWTAGGLCALVLSGCGPTGAGIQARQDANDRLGLLNAQVSYDQARQSFEVGRFDRALPQIEAAIEQYPEMGEYYVLKGRIHLETHQLEEAIKSFVIALEKNPDDAEAHYFAGIVFQRWSDDEQSAEHYQAAFEIDSTNVDYLLAWAEALVALGELEPAAELLQSRLEYFEHNAAMHHLLGQIALMQGDLEEAVARYSQARLLNPDDLSLLEELARLQYRYGNYQDCLESVKYLQTLSEEQRQDLMLLEARCLTLLGRPTDARTLYLTLSQLDPTSASVWIELGTIAWELEDFARLSQCSSRVLTLAPDRPEGYMLKGVNERARNNLWEAVDLFREAAQRSSDSALPHLLLGVSLEEQGDEASALAAYREALRIDPASREAQALIERLGAPAHATAEPGE